MSKKNRAARPANTNLNPATSHVAPELRYVYESEMSASQLLDIVVAMLQRCTTANGTPITERAPEPSAAREEEAQAKGFAERAERFADVRLWPEDILHALGIERIRECELAIAIDVIVTATATLHPNATIVAALDLLFVAASIRVESFVKDAQVALLERLDGCVMLNREKSVWQFRRMIVAARAHKAYEAAKAEEKRQLRIHQCSTLLETANEHAQLLGMKPIVGFDPESVTYEAVDARWHAIDALERKLAAKVGQKDGATRRWEEKHGLTPGEPLGRETRRAYSDPAAAKPTRRTNPPPSTQSRSLKGQLEAVALRLATQEMVKSATAAAASTRPGA